LWDVENTDESNILNLVKSHTLDFLDIVKPTPSYIIIGTGKEKREIP
jgi:hypothetical protein